MAEIHLLRIFKSEVTRLTVVHLNPLSCGFTNEKYWVCVLVLVCHIIHSENSRLLQQAFNLIVLLVRSARHFSFRMLHSKRHAEIVLRI